MKESNEGVVLLEMFTESVMRKTLGFIYTGNVQILNEDDVSDMVVIADYLFLLNLKTLAAQALQQKLNASNSISIFRFAYEYRCEELVSKAKNFLLANFTELFAANHEDVLEMSSEELIMLISSDELPVKMEKDVFDIILAWINHDRNMRKNCFTELFRHVRLVYISRDSLCSDIVTNDLVTDNECCLELVKEAIELIDSTKVLKMS
ncbi:Kelch-like protein 2 [Porites harrisoni]